MMAKLRESGAPQPDSRYTRWCSSNDVYQGVIAQDDSQDQLLQETFHNHRRNKCKKCHQAGHNFRSCEKRKKASQVGSSLDGSFQVGVSQYGNSQVGCLQDNASLNSPSRFFQVGFLQDNAFQFTASEVGVLNVGTSQDYLSSNSFTNPYYGEAMRDGGEQRSGGKRNHIN